jgi:hypothetical protein
MDEIQGPLSFKNWKLFLAKHPPKYGWEHPLFSDAYFDLEGMVKEVGPYKLFLLNPFLHLEDKSLGKPRFILQFDNYLPDNINYDFNKTHNQHDTGGNQADEITALISICLGIRIKAGEENRFFSSDKDLRGMPLELGRKTDPSYITSKFFGNQYILPNAIKTKVLKDLDILFDFPLMLEEDAIVLLRAARLYQEAVWLVENTPEISWIFLVSMIEVVANHWRRDDSVVHRFQQSPLGEKITHQIKLYVGEIESVDDLVSEIADILSDYTGSTAKFKDFIMNFLPPPPVIRPPSYAQHSWEQSELRKTLGKIYDYRSKALHAGQPFPAPMCLPPMLVGENNEPEEILSTLAMGTRGSTWVQKDVPIMLHTFEYIARNAVLNWWKSVPRHN